MWEGGQSILGGGFQRGGRAPYVFFNKKTSLNAHPRGGESQSYIWLLLKSHIDARLKQKFCIFMNKNMSLTIALEGEEKASKTLSSALKSAPPPREIDPLLL